jgi:hypothetical protein
LRFRALPFNANLHHRGYPQEGKELGHVNLDALPTGRVFCFCGEVAKIYLIEWISRTGRTFAVLKAL